MEGQAKTQAKTVNGGAAGWSGIAVEEKGEVKSGERCG